MHRSRVKDRRAQRTEALLRDALAALIRERPYDDIAVKEILNRANVGRSTFYAHFRDKDDLLVSGIHDMLRSARPAGGERDPAKRFQSILWFSLPIFEHIERHRHTEPGAMGPRGRKSMHELLEHSLTGLIEGAVKTAERGNRRTRRHVPHELQARWIASTFILVLDWWVDNDRPVPAREADQVFRGLIEPSLGEVV